jgi:hypothetical protein
MSTNNPKRSAPNAKASAQQLSSEVAQFSVSDLAHFSMSLDTNCSSIVEGARQVAFEHLIGHQPQKAS